MSNNKGIITKINGSNKYVTYLKINVGGTWKTITLSYSLPGFNVYCRKAV